MISYISRRIGATLIVLFIASLVAFLLMRVAPGDPARLVMGPLASEASVISLRSQMGLDQPLPVQYVRYLSGLLKGDWGTAWHTRQPVADVLLKRLPATLELSLVAILLTILVGIPLGALSAYRTGGWLDRIMSTFSVTLIATPVFWLGLVLILIFFRLMELVPPPFGRLSPGIEIPPGVTGLLTVDSLVSGNMEAFTDALKHLILPGFTLGLPLAAWLAMITRRSIRDVYSSEFIRTARAKGVRESTILFTHALPNAMLPVLTLVTLSIGDLLAGSLLVEAVFVWPGIGGFVTESISTQDFAPVQGAIILGAFTYSALNLLTDLLYGIIDPRVRIAGGHG